MNPYHLGKFCFRFCLSCPYQGSDPEIFSSTLVRNSFAPSPRKMQYFPLFFLTLCILLATAHAQASNEVVVKVGRTKSLAGSLASISKLLDPGFQIWLNALENQGGVNIGGVKYVFRMQEYNDASGIYLFLSLSLAAMADLSVYFR